MPITNMVERASYSGAKAADAEWAATDYTGLAATDRAEMCILQVVVSVTNAVVEVTFDSGSNWYAINDGDALVIGRMYQFDIYITGGETFNIRATNVGGTTVDDAKIVSDLDG